MYLMKRRLNNQKPFYKVLDRILHEHENLGKVSKVDN